ncbi:MAG: hydroxylase [Alphaproteobacteria bacterium]
MSARQDRISYPIPQPEPGLRPETVIARAAEMRPLLRKEQDESDWRGFYSEEVHERLLEGGFYRLLTPKMFGGYEFDPKVFIQAVMEISRGHPGAGWCFALGASHAYLLASHWSEEVQRELFGADGEFRSPAVGVPAGTFVPAPGGFRITGTWPFASGIPYATHFMAASVMEGRGGPGRRIMFVTPKENVEVLKDWGQDQYWGMQASGSFAVKLSDVFVPDRYIIDTNFDASTDHMANGTPGTRLHGNPIYLGIPTGWFNTEFAAILVGTAWAALDEFREMATTKSQVLNPRAKISEDAFVQNAYGRALALAQSAETLTIACAETYAQQLRGFIHNKTPITPTDSFKIWGMASEAARMACDAVEMLFHHSGGSSGRRGRKMQRYFRDVETYRIHPQAQPFIHAMRAQIDFGTRSSIFSDSDIRN